MTLKSKFKTIFEFNIVRLCHMPKFISIGDKMAGLRRGAMMDTKRPRHGRVKVVCYERYDNLRQFLDHKKIFYSDIALNVVDLFLVNLPHHKVCISIFGCVPSW